MRAAEPSHDAESQARGASLQGNSLICANSGKSLNKEKMEESEFRSRLNVAGGSWNEMKVACVIRGYVPTQVENEMNVNLSLFNGQRNPFAACPYCHELNRRRPLGKKSHRMLSGMWARPP